MNKNNACIYNYTGVYYFCQKEKMPVGDRRYHGAFTII